MRTARESRRTQIFPKSQIGPTLPALASPFPTCSPLTPAPPPRRDASLYIERIALAGSTLTARRAGMNVDSWLRQTISSTPSNTWTTGSRAIS